VCTDGGLLASGHGPHGGSVPRLLSGSHNHTSTKPIVLFILELAAFFFETEKETPSLIKKIHYNFTSFLLFSFQKADCVQVPIPQFKDFCIY
jgi:hypothetical protein